VSQGFTPEATIGPFYPGAFLSDTPQDLWTVGPLVAHRPEGQPIVFVARFVDGLKQPVPSLVVEFWQANARGRYRHPLDGSDRPLDPQFDGFARLRTGDDGTLRFHTIKPGAHPVSHDRSAKATDRSAKASRSSRRQMEREALRLARPELVEGRARSGHASDERSVPMRAPHLRLTIFASGIDRLVTQVFFDDEPLNATDPVLVSIPDPEVRSRLIAARRDLGAEARIEVDQRRPLEYELDIVLRGGRETPFFDDWSGSSIGPSSRDDARPGDGDRDRD